jgi:hypothetical protein
MINRLKNLQNKPEETKVRIIWALAFFGTVIMAGAWYISLGFNNTPRNNDKSLLSSFPDFQKEINNIGKISGEYKTVIGDVVAEGEKIEIQEIVKNYIIENNYLESLPVDQIDADISKLKLKNIEKLKNNWYVEYEQYHNGFLVDGSKISFQVDSLEKKIIASESNFDSSINIDIIEPKITEDETFDLIVKFSKKDNLDLKTSQLVFYKDINKNPTEYNLAWKINVFSLEPAYDYVYFVNAEDGKIILAIDNFKN